jgi:hypothetical protein
VSEALELLRAWLPEGTVPGVTRWVLLSDGIFGADETGGAISRHHDGWLLRDKGRAVRVFATPLEAMGWEARWRAGEVA